MLEREKLESNDNVSKNEVETSENRYEKSLKKIIELTYDEKISEDIFIKIDNDGNLFFDKIGGDCIDGKYITKNIKGSLHKIVDNLDLFLDGQRELLHLFIMSSIRRKIITNLTKGFLLDLCVKKITPHFLKKMTDLKFVNIKEKNELLKQAVEKSIKDYIKNNKTLYVPYLDSIAADIMINYCKNANQYIMSIVKNPEECENKNNWLISIEQFENTHPYITKKLKLQFKLWHLMLNVPKFSNIKFNDVWKFLIDGERHIESEFSFENEPGYICSAMNAFIFILETQNATLNANWYIELQKQFSDGVIKKSYDIMKGVFEEFPQGLRNEEVAFKIDGYKHDNSGFNDLQKRSARKYNFFKLFEQNTRLKFPFYGKDVLYQQIEKLFSIYSKITTINQPETRLIGYLYVARELELHHVFTDGNGRSSEKTFYAFILRDPYFQMCYFYDPNIFDLNGPVALFQYCLDAFKNFSKVFDVQSEPCKLDIGLIKNDWDYYHNFFENLIDQSQRNDNFSPLYKI